MNLDGNAIVAYRGVPEPLTFTIVDVVATGTATALGVPRSVKALMSTETSPAAGTRRLSASVRLTRRYMPGPQAESPSLKTNAAPESTLVLARRRAVRLSDAENEAVLSHTACTG